MLFDGTALYFFMILYSTLFDASNLKGVVETTLQEGRHFHRAMYNATPAVTDQPEQCASKSKN